MNHLIEQAADIIHANDVTIGHCLEESILALVAAAEQVRDNYNEIFYATSGRDGQKRGSRMPNVRSRTTQGGTTLEIRWMRVSRVDDKVHRKSYSKGTGHGYAVGRITQGSPEWEAELVAEAEARFTEIRRVYSQLGKIRKQCATLMQALSNSTEFSTQA